jgi:hypothetical protein
MSIFGLVFTITQTFMSQPTAVLLELQYCPPVQYFVKLLQYRNVFLEQHENFQKGSYRNRCHIAATHGIQRLSVPLVKGKNHQTPIREVQVAYTTPWQQNLWETLIAAYGSSPYFDDYEPFIKPYFDKEYGRLWDLNLDLLKLFLRLLQFEVDIQFTDTYWREAPAEILDLRQSITPKLQHERPDPAFFPAKYPQVFEDKHGFLPNLSILDLLFCNGPQGILTLHESIVTN